jgi:hypothetical protein
VATNISKLVITPLEIFFLTSRTLVLFVDEVITCEEALGK